MPLTQVLIFFSLLQVGLISLVRVMQGITSSTASVSIVGNFVLSNISALAGIGQCSAGAPYNTVNVPVIVQVLLSTGISCNLTSWTGVCSYIAAYAANLSVSACPAS